MITQSKLEPTVVTPEGGLQDDRHLDTQRSGLGILGVLLFPLIAFAALAFAAAELAK